MGKRDRERYYATGKVFRGGKLIPQEKVAEKAPEPTTTPEEAITEVMKEAGIPNISDRLAKMKKQLEE